MTPDVQCAICSICLSPERERISLWKLVICQMFLWVPKNVEASMWKFLQHLYFHIPTWVMCDAPWASTSTPLFQTTNNNISADSCPQCCSRGQSLSESPEQHPGAQLEILHSYRLGVKNYRCGLKQLPSARVRSWGLPWSLLITEHQTAASFLGWLAQDEENPKAAGISPLNWEKHHCLPQDNIKLWLWFEQHFQNDKKNYP